MWRVDRDGIATGSGIRVKQKRKKSRARLGPCWGITCAMITA